MNSEGRAAIVGALTALGLALAAVLTLVIGLYAPGPAKAPTSVVLKRGSDVAEIADTLKGARIINSARMFRIVARLSGAAADLKAGEYEFPAHVSLSRVLDDVHQGHVTRRVVTIPEGWTSGMVLETLEKRPDLTGEAIEPPEGSLLPDTYALERGETRSAVIGRMRAARDKAVAQLWVARQSGLPFDSPEEAVILASIVEKETGVAAERPRVAAVFVNRLRAGMALQSDPTVIYAVSRGRPLGRGLLASELASDSPYNTYRHAGLPPTPIANPGREALAAVLNPPRSRELYFVADGTGGHVFAETYEAHLANVERWRAIERARAGK